MSTRMRPPLKWAGGKFRLLDRILPALPSGSRLVEPFVGSGAVFLNADFPAYLLCDLNEDLIFFFRTLTEEGDAFIREARGLFTPATNTAEAYYAFRNRFNSLAPGKERALLFLYLNRHGFNGLVRYNRKGDFNTPFGRYAAPYFPGDELTAVARKARDADVEFIVADFRASFAALREGDVVYCDPPYAPLSATANFTSYTASDFGPEEQRELAECAVRAFRQGRRVVLSNHDTPPIRRLYRGARISSFDVRRTISCDGQKRSCAKEILAVYA